MNNGQHLTPEGLLKIISIKASCNLGLSPGLKTKFSDVIPVARPEVIDQTIKNPH